MNGPKSIKEIELIIKYANKENSLRGPGNSDTPVVKNTTTTQLSSKHHFSLKGTRAPWRKD